MIFTREFKVLMGAVLAIAVITALVKEDAEFTEEYALQLAFREMVRTNTDSVKCTRTFIVEILGHEKIWPTFDFNFSPIQGFEQKCKVRTISFDKQTGERWVIQ